MTMDKKNINRKKVAKLVRQLLIELGENPDREGLAGTPNRIADMYEEIFGGYRMDAQLDVSFSEETEAVIAKDIQFYSMCEHHMLPFFGKIHVAYIPSGKVFGVSKLVRLVEKYSRRLQIQERLTKQIADELVRMGVKGALVIAEGEHLCMNEHHKHTLPLVVIHNISPSILSLSALYCCFQYRIETSRRIAAIARLTNCQKNHQGFLKTHLHATVDIGSRICKMTLQKIFT